MVYTQILPYPEYYCPVHVFCVLLLHQGMSLHLLFGKPFHVLVCSDLPPDKKRLDWNTRMKIAAGAAKGLEYLHDKANPPVIYRDLKCSNILLGEGYHPKLSDFGLAKLGPVGDKTHVSTRVMGTYGYCAPEYAMTGQLTLKSDVYSFGVVLLEIITGRKAIDNSKAAGEYNLVAWVSVFFIAFNFFDADYLFIYLFLPSVIKMNQFS